MSARFAQVAISVADKEVSLAFYRDLFGLEPVGGTHFSGKATEQVQGMAGASSNCSWLIDDRSYFQFEIFQFDYPLARAYSSNRQPQDIGYSRLIFSVPALAPVAARAGVKIVELHGHLTAFLRDTDGIAIQIIEADVLQARLTGVALSVPDLEAARCSFVDGCGCAPLSAPAPDWGEVWGETGADKDMMLLDGGTITLELSQYRTPVSRGWPDEYRIADHGILNIALGFASARAIRSQLGIMQVAGIKSNAPLATAPGLFALTYSQDRQGFSIETIYISKLAAGAFGFRKANLFDRTLMAIMKAASWLRSDDHKGRQMDNLKHAIITGAGSGLGHGIAERLLKRGVKVSVLDLGVPADRAVTLDAAAKTGKVEWQLHKTDVRKLDSVKAAIAAYGPTELAVNFADVGALTTFADMEDTEFYRVMDINVIGSYHFARAVMPHLRKGGRLALTASMAGITSNYGYTSYGTSKFAVGGLATTLRYEYEPLGIGVTAICPPEVITPMVHEEKMTGNPIGLEIKRLAGSLQPDYACDKILAGLIAGKRVIIPGFKAKATAFAAQRMPGLFDWAIKIMVRKVMKNTAHCSLAL